MSTTATTTIHPELDALWPGYTPLKPHDKGAIINAEFIRKWSLAHGVALADVIPLYTDTALRVRETTSGLNLEEKVPDAVVGSVQNEILAQPSNPYALRKDISELTHFFIIPVPVFEYFERQYGSTSRFIRIMARTGLLRTARATPQLYPSFVRVVPCIPTAGEALRDADASVKLIINDLEITARPIIFSCPESTSVQRALAFALTAWKDNANPAELVDMSLEAFDGASAVSYDNFPAGIEANRIRCYVRQNLDTKAKAAREAALERLQKIQSGEIKPYYPASWPFAPPGAKLAPEIVIDEQAGDEALKAQEQEVIESFQRIPVPVDTSAGENLDWVRVPGFAQTVSSWPIPEDASTPELMIEVRGNVDESATATDIALAWPRGRFIAPEAPRFIYPGKLVDALDKQMNWYKARVLYKNNTRPVTWRVTYLDWASNNDEDVLEDLIEAWDTCTKDLPNKRGRHMTVVGKPVRLVGRASTTTTPAYHPAVYNHYGMEQAGQPGRAGLENLGNTCFMNSILQCISAMPLLTDLFLDKARAQALVNRQSKLGKGGRLAEQLTKWLEDMWCGKYGVVNPSGLRSVVVKGTPFDGYEQHDSSEFLTYLLDNIHEELNQCTEKPQTQEVEAKGRDDFLVAQEAWETHLKRNRSWVCDRFGGQIKSTLVCQQCKNISVKFDYMQFLTVGLPVDKNLTRTVSVVRTSPKVSLTTVTIRLGPNDTVQTILDTLAQDEAHFSPKLERRRLVLREPGYSAHAAPWKGTIVAEKKMADELSKDSLYVYELQPNVFCDPAEDISGCAFFPVRIRFPESIHTGSATTEDIPLLLAVPKTLKIPPFSTTSGVATTTPADTGATSHALVPVDDSVDGPALCAPEAPPRPSTPDVEGPIFTSGVEGTTPAVDVPDVPDATVNTTAAAAAAAAVTGAAAAARSADAFADDEREMEDWSHARFDHHTDPEDPDDSIITSSSTHVTRAKEAPAVPPKRKSLMESAGVGNLGSGAISSLHAEIRSHGGLHTGSGAGYAGYGSLYGGIGSMYGAYHRPTPPSVKVPAKFAFEAVVELMLSSVLNPSEYPSLKSVFGARNATPDLKAAAEAELDEPEIERAPVSDDDDEPEEKKSEVTESKLTDLKLPSMLKAWGIDPANVPLSVTYAEDWAPERTTAHVTATGTNTIELVNFGTVSGSMLVDLGNFFNTCNAPAKGSDATPPTGSVADEPTLEMAGGGTMLASAAGGVSGKLAPSYNDAKKLAQSLLYTEVAEQLRSATAPEDSDSSSESGSSRGERMPPKPTTYFSQSGSQSRRSMYYNPHSVTGSSRLNLLDSLKEYSQTELLQDDNAVYCRICKTHTPTTKRLEIFRLPDVLIIVLKRFSTRDFVNYHKNDTPVDYPLLGLDMSDYMADPVRREYQAVCREASSVAESKTGDTDAYYNHPKAFESEFRNIMATRPTLHGFPLQNDYTYDLTGVSLHSGSRTGGHYTAHTRNFLTGDWMHCDDRRISDMSLDAAQDDQAYVLCYQRRRCTRDIEPAVSGLAPFKFPAGIPRFQTGKNMVDTL